MSQTIYQLQDQSTIFHIFEQTTLETCSDVTYTWDEIKEMFGGNLPHIGSAKPDTITTYGSKGYVYNGSDKLIMVNVPALIKEINHQLEKSKEAVLDIPDGLCVHEANASLFKPLGLRFSSNKQVFVKYKPPKKKVVVRVSIMNELRNVTNSAIERIIRTKYGVWFEFKSCRNKKDQASIVQFGNNNGITLEQVLNYTSEYYPFRNQNIKDMIVTKLKSCDELEMYEATLAEYIKWFNECISNKKVSS